ncbi:hypothetical protein BKH21_11445 [Actinomyces oris]|uniref:hypothetical protein n=1 Tax=Actinomyces oris TaxID=544580 RepID=UPI00094BF376|nr:hypothetical protein [Actinomyces oris]OLO65688.1 hypothetical protein BKH21_11445 [Actinomyces oris]
MTVTPQATSDLSASPASSPAGGSSSQSRRSEGLRPARPLLTYLWLDLYRSLREPANLFFVVAFPVAMYLVFGRLNASAGDYGPHAHGNVSASVMLAMASFSASLGATSASAAAAVEQSAGWGRQMAVTSRGLRGYLVVKTGTAVGTAALPVVVVLTAGALTDSQMEGWAWATSPLICLIGVLPFVLWGLAAGMWLPSSASIGIATSLVSLFAFIGNAFMPLNRTLLTISRFTPMYGSTALARWPLGEGWTYVPDRQAGVQDPLWMPLANLVAWTLIFGLLVIGARRRVTGRR